MSYWKQAQIYDIYNNVAACTPNQEIRVVDPVRLCGGIFNGSTVDPNFWSTTLVGSGTVTQSNGVQTAATGTTANSSAIVSSIANARYIGQSINLYGAAIALGDTGVANNVRRWGAMNAGTDGAYFMLNGTTLYVATMKGGVETAIASTSWNGNQTVPTLTNENIYRIQMRPTLVIFDLNGVTAHTITTNTATWTNNINTTTWLASTNSNGLTTNCSISSWVNTIYRLGKLESQPMSTRVTTATTTVAKYGPGLLRRITVGTPASSSSTLTVYDNTSAAGTILSIVQGPAQANPVTLEYGLAFNNGLTLVSTGTWDATVVYEQQKIIGVGRISFVGYNAAG